ncbi:DUF1003 domain-containing protein [Alicyclobacillus fastidiosus]|uniref:DUF1003 domain-containing protein n=1 Tax=Alicyclobacillus fastidiosus TaxID=392011 RepID=A0ABY6ZMG5_9BACL|nr:DUF1003 domain-containing protein [Alicyclobacillus fastidiosus]WAH43386.1 DUF1003 domain-containing protein [Alicyclobacillus fastidiosus]GMA65452.1 hypothetical protein GCM10025859_58920 [Alicyclobacillus fastidiosus]
MGKRSYDVKLQDIRQEAFTFEGFDIPINETDAKRIDRLVDNYERRIMMHLDDDYIRRTKWTEGLADRIASFGGSWSFIIIFALILAVWILWNTLPFTPFHFDKHVTGIGYKFSEITAQS